MNNPTSNKDRTSEKLMVYVLQDHEGYIEGVTTDKELADAYEKKVHHGSATSNEVDAEYLKKFINNNH